MGFFTKRKIIVSGAGFDGKGAIINSSAKSQYNALMHGELAGDVVFGGTLSDARWDFRDDSFAMNGHNTTKVGSNMVCFTAIALAEGGTVGIDVKEGMWSSETTTSYSGGPLNRLTVRSGSYFDLYVLSTPFTWSILFEDGSAYKARYATNRDQNVLTGPIELESGRVSMITENGSESWSTITGPVSGAGGRQRREMAGSFSAVVRTHTPEGPKCPAVN